MESKRRRKSVLLEVFGTNQFLEFLIFLAPALWPQKVLIALVLDLLLLSICLLCEMTSEQIGPLN